MAVLNANFANQAAFSFAKEMKRTWVFAWTKSTPFLRMLTVKNGKFQNQRFTNVNGLFGITPIGLSDITSGGAIPETAANQGIPATFEVTNGATQAQFYWATYKKTIWLTNQEQDQLKGDTNWVPVMQYKQKQLRENFRKQLGADVVGSQQDSGLNGTGQVMGQQYPLSQSNNPGNISQSSNAVWQAGLQTGVGAFNTTLISAEMDRIGDLDRGDADFVQLSYSPNNNTYLKLYSAIEGAQVLTREEDEAKFGFKSFGYRGLDCFRDGRLGDVLPGSMVVGKSDAWLWTAQTPEPRIGPGGWQAQDATLNMVATYYWTVATGIDDPATQTLFTGIAA
jgi:hypothetical protein